MLSTTAAPRSGTVMCAMGKSQPGRNTAASRLAGNKKLQSKAATSPAPATTPKLPSSEAQIDNLLAKLHRRESNKSASSSGRDGSKPNKTPAAAPARSMERTQPTHGAHQATHAATPKAAPSTAPVGAAKTAPAAQRARSKAALKATPASAVLAAVLSDLDIAAPKPVSPPVPAAAPAHVAVAVPMHETAAASATAESAAASVPRPAPPAARARLMLRRPGTKPSASKPSKPAQKKPMVPEIELTEDEMDSIFDQVEATVLRKSKSKDKASKAMSMRVEDEEDSGLSGWLGARGLRALINEQEGLAAEEGLADESDNEEEDKQAAGTGSGTKRSSGPASTSAAAPGGSGSGFKGFGITLPAATSTASTGSTTAVSTKARGLGHAAAVRSKVAPLRIFMYAAEVAKTQEAIEEAGLAGQVEIVGDLKQAQAIVSCKVARSGSHNRLQQAERTAANMDVPFVCVGRHMTAENLGAALASVLAVHQGRGQKGGTSLRNAVLSSRSTSRPQGEWRRHMAQVLGL